MDDDTLTLPEIAARVGNSDGRYEVLRPLGHGAAGAVHLVRDRETGEQVALKTLFRVDSKSILRLKREFRSLVGLAHPNLVKVYDMGRADDGWFLTMEHVAGVDLTTYLTAEPTGSLRSQRDRRVLSSLAQLARGIRALHRAGLLHRDLKPSNVMVVDGRVVVLDFGLVRELSAGAVTLTEDGSMSGTPAYMAPEQIRGAELAAAADWYAFGVIMYEVLSGELPFQGALLDILRHKLEHEPAALSERAPGAPRWLCELCMALLRRDASLRPSGDDVIAAFDAAQGTANELPRTATERLVPTEADAQPGVLYGRKTELAKLRQLFEAASSGCTVVTHVRGLSGIGKSALIEQFLSELELQRPGAALVLRSRCHELEQLPFKALDGLLDAVARLLGHSDDLEVAHLLPKGIAALTQVFPVIGRLRAVQRLITGTRELRDADEARQQAELALRQLLERLAERQPLVLWIDDLQWGDLDSARMLRGWLQSSSQAAILLVLSYRSDETATSSCLASLLQASPEPHRAHEHVVELARLGDTEIHALCTRRLGTRAAAHPELVARIACEAQGNPFFAAQLIVLADAKLARGDEDPSQWTLAALIAQSMSLVSEDARRLLEVLAIAGRPVAPRLALTAAGVHHNGRALVHTLRGLNLLRTRDVGGARMLEIFHDRVREHVQAGLSPERRVAINEALLRALEFAGQDPNWLFNLALGAGRRDQALRHGLSGADRAAASLAFEQAAELYQRCLEIAPEALARELWTKLASACVRCGRGVQGADAYIEAAKRQSGEQAQQSLQLAAAHLLRSGHVERAEQLMRDTLEAIGSPMPRTHAGTVAALAWERARIKLRGLKYTLRTDAPAALLAQHDVLYAFSSGLHPYDALRSELLHARALLCALEAGEPNRLVRALSWAAIALSFSRSAHARAQIDGLLSHAAELARDLAPRVRGEVASGRAICAAMLGDLPGVIAPSLEAEEALRADAGADALGDYFRRYGIASTRVFARLELGDLRLAAEELHELVARALATNNRAALLSLTYLQTIVEHNEDRIASSRVRLDEQARELPSESFGMAHASHLEAVLVAAGATGEFEWAREHLRATWPRWSRSPLRHNPWFCLGVYQNKIALTLHEGFQDGKLSVLRSAVRDDLKILQQNRFAAGTVQHIEARLAYAEGDRARATALFLEATNALLAQGLPVHAEYARFAHGALVGGSEGAAEQALALDRLRAFGIVNPWHDVRSWTPELT